MKRWKRKKKKEREKVENKKKEKYEERTQSTMSGFFPTQSFQIGPKPGLSFVAHMTGDRRVTDESRKIQGKPRNKVIGEERANQMTGRHFLVRTVDGQDFRVGKQYGTDDLHGDRLRHFFRGKLRSDTKFLILQAFQGQG